MAALGLPMSSRPVEGRERPDRAEQHPHRVGVVAEALEELLHVDVDVGVVADPSSNASSCSTVGARPRGAGTRSRGTSPPRRAARSDSRGSGGCPASPSMKVIALRHEAVLRYAGSYDISPPSPSSALTCRRSVAWIVSSVIGTVYSRPVRLSVIVSVSSAMALPLPRFVPSSQIAGIDLVAVPLRFPDAPPSRRAHPAHPQAGAKVARNAVWTFGRATAARPLPASSRSARRRRARQPVLVPALAPRDHRARPGRRSASSTATGGVERLVPRAVPASDAEGSSARPAPATCSIRSRPTRCSLVPDVKLIALLRNPSTARTRSTSTRSPSAESRCLRGRAGRRGGAHPGRGRAARRRPTRRSAAPGGTTLCARGRTRSSSSAGSRSSPRAAARRRDGGAGGRGRPRRTPLLSPSSAPPARRSTSSARLRPRLRADAARDARDLAARFAEPNRRLEALLGRRSSMAGVAELR